MSQKWALLVGINEYQRGDITSLSYAVQDVHDLAKTLEISCSFEKDKIITLTSDSEIDKPTCANIAHNFDYLARNVQAADTFIFYFAGHGLLSEDASYLLTYEADTRSQLTRSVSCLPVESIKNWMNRIPARTVLAFYDACRNEPTQSRGQADNLLNEVFARDLQIIPKLPIPAAPIEASATFYACRVGERSYESQSYKHGFFTYYLISGLEGRAANTSGDVTLNSLEHFLEQEVPRATAKEINVHQQPWVAREGSGVGELILTPRRSSVRKKTLIIGKPPVVEPLDTRALLSITSIPQHARVSIEGQFLGYTPLSHSIDLGARPELPVIVVLEKEGYHSQGALIKLIRGETNEWHDVVLQAQKPLSDGEESEESDGEEADHQLPPKEEHKTTSFWNKWRRKK